MTHLASRRPADPGNRPRGGRAADYSENRSGLLHLAQEAQHRRRLRIAGGGSRVPVTAIFAADPGAVGMHRQVASPVPPFAPDGDGQGTSAPVGPAVAVPQVAHLRLVGQSNSGGVPGSQALCAWACPPSVPAAGRPATASAALAGRLPDRVAVPARKTYSKS